MMTKPIDRNRKNGPHRVSRPPTPRNPAMTSAIAAAFNSGITHYEPARNPARTGQGECLGESRGIADMTAMPMKNGAIIGRRRELRNTPSSYEALRYPLEQAVYDHTVLDICVVDQQTGLNMERPKLTVLFDTATACILGYNLSSKLSYVPAIACLWHAIGPKDYLATRYPALKNPWPCCGIPDKIVADRSPEFQSLKLQRAVADLNAELHYSRVAQKHSVERFFANLTKDLPGLLRRKSSNTVQPDYRGAKSAAIPLETLNEVIHTWIVDVYHTTQNRSTLESPLARWRRLMPTNDRALPASAKAPSRPQHRSYRALWAPVACHGTTERELNVEEGQTFPRKRGAPE